LKTSGGESSICKEETSYIRSLTPGQAPGNALAVRFSTHNDGIFNRAARSLVILAPIFLDDRKLGFWPLRRAEGSPPVLATIIQFFGDIPPLEAGFYLF
jgi:hypothetical protein